MKNKPSSCASIQNKGGVPCGARHLFFMLLVGTMLLLDKNLPRLAVSRSDDVDARLQALLLNACCVEEQDRLCSSSLVNASDAVSLRHGVDAALHQQELLESAARGHVDKTDGVVARLRDFERHLIALGRGEVGSCVAIGIRSRSVAA